MQFRYRDSIEYRDTGDGIVIMVPISGIAQQTSAKADTMSAVISAYRDFRSCFLHCYTVTRLQTVKFPQR